METLHKVALTLTIIGAINWGSVGLFDFNIVEAIFGTATEFVPFVVPQASIFEMSVSAAFLAILYASSS